MPNLALTRLVAIAFAALVATPAAAQDWPQFRGPTGQGLAECEHHTIKWDSSTNVAWRIVPPGGGWSSPSLHNKRIYLTAAVPVGDGDNKDQSLRALCIDAGDGKIIWSKEVFLQNGATAPRIHSKNSHASPTPLIDGDRLYVHFGHQGTACLDLQGNIIWKSREINYRPVHGNGGTPVLVDNALIFSVDGASQQFVVALDRTTGKVIWKTARGIEGVKKFAFCTALAITVGGKKQVVSPGANAVIAYDPATGREIWRVAYEGYSVVPRPVYGNGLVFISTGFDSPSVLAIRPDGKGEVTETHVAWALKKGAPHSPSMLLVADHLYMVSDRGVASCVAAETGEVVWQKRIGGNYSASPVFVAGKIYFPSEQGTTTVIDAAPEFKQLAVNPLDERTLASYAVTDGSLFIRTANHLYRIDAP